MSDEEGWLIERKVRGELTGTWLTSRSSQSSLPIEIDWTTDPNATPRFARAEDALQIASILIALGFLKKDELSINHHIWVNQ